MDENVWILWNCFTISAYSKVPFENALMIFIYRLWMILFSSRGVHFLGWLTDAFWRLADFSKYYKRAAPLVMRISRISSIFFHKVTFILIHIYHIVSRWSILLAWSHSSFITSVISFAVDKTLTESKRHMRHKAPWETCQVSLSRWPFFFQKYWFPSLNLIQVSHDNSDSLLIFSKNRPRGFKPWWPVSTLQAGIGSQERWVKCDLAESYFFANILPLI